MSYNMMFRRRALIGALILGFVIMILSQNKLISAQTNATLSNSSDDITKELGAIEADVLLVYGGDLSEVEVDSIEIIVKTMTYQQRSIVYMPYNKVGELLDNYENIICYNLDKESIFFIRKLAVLDKNVFFFGGNAVIEYVKKKGYQLTAEGIDRVTVSTEYDFDMQQTYSAMVKLQNTCFLNGDFNYQSGTIKYKNKDIAIYSQFDSFLYTPCIDLTHDILIASLAKEVAFWLWPYQGQPHIYSQYIVLDEVYPFIPPKQLMETVDYLVGLKLPFVISVMPLYDNGDYPAMERFCEVLAYAQGHGGAIILRAPNMVQQTDDIEQVWEYLTYATEAYTNFGVYPLGIQVPESYLFNETSMEILRRYSTVFCYKDGGESQFAIEEGFNTIYREGHNLIAPSYSINEVENIQVLSMPTAAYIDLSPGIASVKEEIDAYIDTKVVLKSLWELEQNVYANNLHLYTEKSNLYFNGEKVDLEYKPFIYKPYKYSAGVYQWILMDLSGLNKQLFIIVIIASSIFIAFILAGRRLNKKQFLLPREKEYNDDMG